MNPQLVDQQAEFTSFGLDERLLKAISKLGWQKPTLVQSAGIPLALRGKDILGKAKTGSGKTAAYSLPILHNLLIQKDKKPAAAISVLVVVPTRELVEQVREHFATLIQHCSRSISVYGVAADNPINQQKPKLKEQPDILVGTPARIVEHLQAKNITLANLKVLVVDEADLVLSYGYQQDIDVIVRNLPKILQSFLMSATLSPEVQALKKNILHTPAVLKLEESELDGANLTEYSLRCQNKDRLLIVYSLVRLKIIPGKALFFVNNIEQCYRLKLLLERFSIKSAVLNSELPQNSRYHILQEFSKGIFDYLIATDESFSDQSKAKQGSNSDLPVENDDQSAENSTTTTTTSSTSKPKKDAEYGVTRGVDFQGVKTVINVDFPTSIEAYIHRIGRTARGTQKGTALSLITPQDEELFTQVEKWRSQEGKLISEYTLNLAVIESLRYRVDDVTSSLSKNTLRDARLAEIKKEILNSEKLKSHFQENPQDLKLIEHDKVLSRQPDVMPHLKFLPEYLVPAGLVPSNTTTQRREAKTKRTAGRDNSKNPLKSFSYSGQKRKREGEGEEEIFDSKRDPEDKWLKPKNLLKPGKPQHKKRKFHRK